MACSPELEIAYTGLLQAVDLWVNPFSTPFMRVAAGFVFPVIGKKISPVCTDIARRVAKRLGDDRVELFNAVAPRFSRQRIAPIWQLERALKADSSTQWASVWACRACACSVIAHMIAARPLRQRLGRERFANVEPLADIAPRRLQPAQGCLVLDAFCDDPHVQVMA